MEAGELLRTAARAIAVYALLLAVIRLLGRRTIGNFTAFDLLVALMLGEVVDEIIYGDVSFLQGAAAIGTVAAAHYAQSWLGFASRPLRQLLEGEPVAVVEDGRLRREGMRAERMSDDEVRAALRLHGIEDLREVRLALVENDGMVSVIRQPWAEPLQKADLGGEAEQERERATGGREEPPPSGRTTPPPRR